jgi:hypothetical protein
LIFGLACSCYLRRYKSALSDDQSCLSTLRIIGCIYLIRHRVCSPDFVFKQLVVLGIVCALYYFTACRYPSITTHHIFNHNATNISTVLRQSSNPRHRSYHHISISPHMHIIHIQYHHITTSPQQAIVIQRITTSPHEMIKSHLLRVMEAITTRFFKVTSPTCNSLNNLLSFMFTSQAQL